LLKITRLESAPEGFQIGLPIFEITRQKAPLNRMKYEQYSRA
jgi:hypothetical protein